MVVRVCPGAEEDCTLDLDLKRLFDGVGFSVTRHPPTLGQSSDLSVLLRHPKIQKFAILDPLANSHSWCTTVAVS